MWERSIAFGRRLQGNFTIRYGDCRHVEGSDARIRQAGAEVVLELPDGSSVMVEPLDEGAETLLEECAAFPEQTVSWIEQVHASTVYVRAIHFGQHFRFYPEAPLRFIIDAAVRHDLLQAGGSAQTDPVSFFTQKFLHNGRAYAIAAEASSRKMRLIGDGYMCDIEESHHKAYHCVCLIRWRGRDLNKPVSLLKGDIRFVDELTDVSALRTKAHAEFMASIAETEDYLRLWELYNELESETRKQEVMEYGVVEYAEVKFTTGMDGEEAYHFTLTKPLPPIFPHCQLGFEAAAEPPRADGDSVAFPGRSVYVGSKIRPSSDSRKLIIAFEPGGGEQQPPDRGYLMGAFNGSRQMLQRRLSSLEKVRGQATPLVSLSALLQKGDAPVSKERSIQALTSKTARKALGSTGTTFTEMQRAAIQVALNTPDMAIIQGPPGTGKTSVIKAIISRIDERHKGGAKVLVTSYQHDAVDNAVEGMSAGGLPVNRFGSRRGRREEEQLSHVRKWADELRASCESVLRSMDEHPLRQKARAIRLCSDLVRRSIRDFDVVFAKISELYELCVPILPTEICGRLAAWLTAASAYRAASPGESAAEAQSDHGDPILERLSRLLESQRLDADMFEDDGAMQALRLRSFLRRNWPDREVPHEIEAAAGWEDCTRPGTETMILSLRGCVERLKEAFFRQEAANDAMPTLRRWGAAEIGYVDKLLQAVADGLQRELDRHQANLADFLIAFIEDLDQPDNMDEIVKRYTQVSAATCQQAAARKYGQTVYDYVIIDEAARANPLDLLIPMSMGHKIILVGDQEQLPHMLEPKVLNRFIAEQPDPEVKQFLQQTLFERLFEQFRATELKGGIRRTAMLVDQFRMHPTIGRFVSETFYQGKLESPLPADKRSHGLPLYGTKPVAWIDLPYSLGAEKTSRAQSKYRRTEIEHLLAELRNVIELNDTYTIGVITFYKEQAICIQNELADFPVAWRERMMVGSVDAFQGREFDIVFLSTVRSNRHEEMEKRVGFLDSRNRLNVAFSRAKRLLVALGDLETVGCSGGRVVVPELHAFSQLCMKEGYYEKR